MVLFMKIKIGIAIILLFIFGVCIFHKQSTSKFYVQEDDQSLIIPNDEKNQIVNELQELLPFIEQVKKDDPLDGFSNGAFTPVLSKHGVEQIKTKLSTLPVGVMDEQGYFNFDNKQVLETFHTNVQKQKNARAITYTILKNGGLSRKDFIYENKKLYLIVSYIDWEDNQLVARISYGKEIDQFMYDANGYISYHIILPDKIVEYGGLAYDGFRIDPIDEELRALNQKYILPISYECNNLFSIDWGQDSFKQIQFSDVLEYLYVLDTDQPFYGSDFPATMTQYIRNIDAPFFESLIMKYLPIDQTTLRSLSCYDAKTNTYAWYELNCGASHYKLPKLYPEVIKAEKEQDLWILDVQATSYETGIPIAFTHKVTIRLFPDGNFQYIKNEIVTSKDNHIPEYRTSYPCSLGS